MRRDHLAAKIRVETEELFPLFHPHRGPSAEAEASVAPFDHFPAHAAHPVFHRKAFGRCCRYEKKQQHKQNKKNETKKQKQKSSFTPTETALKPKQVLLLSITFQPTQRIPLEKTFGIRIHIIIK